MQQQSKLTFTDSRRGQQDQQSTEDHFAHHCVVLKMVQELKL